MSLKTYSAPGPLRARRYQIFRAAPLRSGKAAMGTLQDLGLVARWAAHDKVLSATTTWAGEDSVTYLRAVQSMALWP